MGSLEFGRASFVGKTSWAVVPKDGWYVGANIKKNVRSKVVYV